MRNARTCDPSHAGRSKNLVVPVPRPSIRRSNARNDRSLPRNRTRDCRECAIDLRRGVASGINPVEAKRRERELSQSRTFGALAERYLNEHARRFKRSAAADERNLRLHILPKWAKRRFDEITRADVIELCEGMVAAGTQTNANRVQALISKIFAFGVDAGLLSANPCHRLAKRASKIAAAEF